MWYKIWNNITRSIKMNMTRELRQTFHVRLKPAPAILLATDTWIHDRLEITEAACPHLAGVYRRISFSFLQQLGTEADKSPDPARRSRLQEIFELASTSPAATDDDLENLPLPDLSYY